MTTETLEHIKDNAPVDKTASEAHIGYLVGYRASMPFLIWIPSLRKTEVIVSANVGFNEAATYDPVREKEAAAVQEYTYEILKQMTQVNSKQGFSRYHYEIVLGVGGDDLDVQPGRPIAAPEGFRKEVTHDKPLIQIEESTGDVFLTPPASNEGGTVNTISNREVQELIADDFNDDKNSLETQQ
ncbi:hypothetical protein EDB81DRAFT_884969 [Dactylonectria macrodidyma]|uniref:Uncharacterized protein n=1 Tax=Dactylonectria macrodidyma TaxID=307937 RepID=A0A9P9EQR3_9HYPO|nr:hypothetical protein EDB81DRAFT_884969 [Dactylonectria macrodidyma]